MSSGDADKPLPRIPQRRDLSVLTVEARAHLRRFLDHSLDEEGDIIPVEDRGVWASTLEDALLKLGASVSHGGWLAGIRCARKIRKEYREAEESRKTLEIREKEKNRSEDAALDVPDKTPSSSQTAGQRRELALTRLRTVLTKQESTSGLAPQHLLLTVTTHGTRSRGMFEDRGGSGSQHPALGCDFSAGDIVLPTCGRDVSVLYGLEEWDTQLWSEKADDIHIIGGSFHLKGVESASQQVSLCKVLRLSVYVYLSLLLEVHLLCNSQVEVHLHEPTIVAVASTPLMDMTPPGEQDEEQKGRRKSGSPSGLWSFVARQTGQFLHRAVNAGPSLGRRGSLELPATKTTSSESSDGRPLSDNAHRRPGFSLIGPSAWKGRSKSRDVSERRRSPSLSPSPFATTVGAIEAFKDLLSTSPGLEFPVPGILVSLAEKEMENSTRKLTGDERVALSSLVGWEGKAAQAKGMTGTLGFVRHQWISALYSEHVPILSPASHELTPAQSRPPSPNSSRPPSSSSCQVPRRVAHCGERRPVTYRYYSGGSPGDESLGEMIVRMCSTADNECEAPGCPYKRAEHDLRWIHHRVRIVAAVEPVSDSQEQSNTEDGDRPRMWLRCALCGAESRKQQMSDGTYLFSFGKYLELLLYSSIIFLLSPPVCEHTTASQQPGLPKMRFNILRRFTYGSHTVTFALSELEDIFEIKVPRLQILRGKNGNEATEPSGSSTQRDSSAKRQAEDDRNELRAEIRRWWQGLSEHMDKLEGNFAKDSKSTQVKQLPRLPFENDAYKVFDETNASTLKDSLASPPTHDIKTSIVQPSKSDSYLSYRPDKSGALERLPSAPRTPLSDPGITSTPLSSPQSQGPSSVNLFSSLRRAFQRTEQALYAELYRTPTESLNDVRRSFFTDAQGAMKRLLAWKAKHSSQFTKDLAGMGEPSAPEPEWWKTGSHAVSGGNVIVCEDDWGSIIAFTLSCSDYQRELANMSTSRLTAPPAPPPTPSVETRSSFFSAPSTLKRLIGSPAPQPDPDQDDVVWHEPESHSAVITRKEYPREAAASLLALRSVLRQPKVSSGDASPMPASPKTGNATPASYAAPPSVFSKPAVEVSKHAAGGELSGMPEAADAAGKILHGVKESRTSASSMNGLPPESRFPSSGASEFNIRKGKASSILISDSAGSTSAGSDTSRGPTPPPLPPKDEEASTPDPDGHGPESRAASPPTRTGTLTSSIANAVRYMLKPDTQRRATPKSHHGLLHAESPIIDERPHIKYDWTIGKRLKFSCTVYYARQFDSLRRRLGIQDSFLKSLAKSKIWTAEGGKSKANFWKTTDDQFIIKTLVDAWNVADLQVLNELCPSYFRYIDSTASRPSVLAKLLGFYTIEVRNLETGTTQIKGDVVVMENLFYKQKISRTFDLKGIHGRKVKASSSSGSKTLLDGEWIEGQQRALTLVRPYSKVVFQEAIRADCDFLARSNIMDYSLLLGVNEEQKQIVCGLVDTIGSYTFAKTLEYKAKQGLSSAKEVTVVPPYEYEERFVTAMDEYFIACPDKWSRPLDDAKIPNDYTELPSVL